jgi:hypothetical protein
MDELYIGTAIGLIYLIVEIVMNKVNKTESPTLFKDSMIVSVISIIVLYAKNHYFNSMNVKTPVFINEPGF